VAVIDIAGAGQFRTARTDIDVVLLIEDEVGSAEGAIRACRFVPHWYVRCDVAINQPFEQSYCAISRVARQSPGPQIEAALNTIYRGLGDSNLHSAVRASAYRIEDDPDLVVDQVVRVISEEWVHTGSRNPCRLRFSEGDFFGRLASMTAFARSATISTKILVAARGIEGRKLLANRLGCHLCPRPCKRLIARNPFLPIHVRLDQARIDRERLASNQPGRNAHRHHTLEHPA
jgi:hypothetical protein